MSARNQHAPGFKANVSLQALKGVQTAAEPATRPGVRPTLIQQLKKTLVDGASRVVEHGGRRKAENDAAQAKASHARTGALAAAFVRLHATPQPSAEDREFPLHNSPCRSDHATTGKRSAA